jgi:hypothetical protein
MYMSATGNPESRHLYRYREDGVSESREWKSHFHFVLFDSASCNFPLAAVRIHISFRLCAYDFQIKVRFCWIHSEFSTLLQSVCRVCTYIHIEVHDLPTRPYVGECERILMGFAPSPILPGHILKQKYQEQQNTFRFRFTFSCSWFRYWQGRFDFCIRILALWARRANFDHTARPDFGKRRDKPDVSNVLTLGNSLLNAACIHMFVQYHVSKFGTCTLHASYFAQIGYIIYVHM